MFGRSPAIHARANATFPSLPLCTYSRAAITLVWLRRCIPAWITTLYLRAASTIRRPSIRLCETGFSTYTCLPRSAAQMVASACQWSGADTTIAVTVLSSSTLRMSVSTFGDGSGFFSAASVGFTIAGSGSTRCVISTPCTPANTGASCLPRTRSPMTASRTFSLGLSAARL